MPDFSTPVIVTPPSYTIDYQSRLFFLGSCFAENMGKRMLEYKFTVCHNPFGVLYNPHSIAKSIKLLLHKREYTESDLQFHNELWFSFDHYTLFSDPDKQACLNKINVRFAEAKKALMQADILIITLGTSWVYRYRKTGEVVSNCHKIPSSEFERGFSGVDLSGEILKEAILELRKVNPGIKIILSVSPIRHVKDGVVENQRSKAALLLTVSALEKDIPSVIYFPSYEIIMDELRDYRFYAADMLHPSEEAQNYIWEKFSDAWLSDESKEILRNVQSILNSVKHRPQFTTTNSYRKFVQTTTRRIEDLRKKHPYIDFSTELKTLIKVY